MDSSDGMIHKHEAFYLQAALHERKGSSPVLVKHRGLVQVLQFWHLSEESLAVVFDAADHGVANQA